MAEVNDLIVRGNSNLIGNVHAGTISASNVTASNITASWVQATTVTGNSVNGAEANFDNIYATSTATSTLTASAITSSGPVTAARVSTTSVTASIVSASTNLIAAKANIANITSSIISSSTNIIAAKVSASLISASTAVTASNFRGTNAYITNLYPTKISASAAVTASAFFKPGGTATQFLKANGSVDSNVYATTSSVSASIAAVEKVFVINPSSTTWAEVATASSEKVVFYKGAVLEYISTIPEDNLMEEASFSRLAEDGGTIVVYQTSGRLLTEVVGNLPTTYHWNVTSDNIEDYVQLSTASNSSIDALFGIVSS